MSADAVIATVPVGSQPRGVAAHPDGRRVCVANAGDGTVSVFDAPTATVEKTIAVGSAPCAFGQFIKPFCTQDADCDDGLSCTTDSYNLAQGLCTHSANCATPTATPTSTPTPASSDSHGDGIADGADNCPTVFNPDQADLHGDGLGDTCDPQDAALNLEHITLRPNSSMTSDNGSVRARGTYLAQHNDGLEANAGLRVTVSAVGNVVDTLEWAASECSPTSRGGLRCVSATRRYRIALRPVSRQPGTVRFRLQATRRAFTGLLAGPATLTLEHLQSAIDRVGSASSCTSFRQTLHCSL
ncbi:MAG: hypothetical protein N3C12_08285 [Candidatus Binatia bacterium]|nr:hypothetical protein [Candidatus Binatia bacterium]